MGIKKPNFPYFLRLRFSEKVDHLTNLSRGRGVNFETFRLYKEIHGHVATVFCQVSSLLSITWSTQDRLA